MDKLRIGLEILNKLNEYSFEAYIVGGAVRDFVRKKKIQDVDIATNAKPSDIENLFLNVTNEGKDFLSCRIHYKGNIFEVTTFRKDLYYLDHRHPLSIPVDTIEEDLSRRDFTMNALAMNQNQEIIDLYHGIEDIQNHVIKVIGDPKIRFTEDALRVLRALDFASRFNYDLDKEILNSLSIDYVSNLKEEYILTMVKKIASNPYPLGLKYIKEYQILRGYPFYQVLCEELYQNKYTKNIFALFYSIHHFLPANLKASKQELKQAMDIGYLVRNAFSNVALYYGNLYCLEEALELYNILYQKNLTIEEIQKNIKGLSIHSPRDIDLDWNKIASKDRGKITKILEQKILNHEVENKKEALIRVLEIED